MGKGTFLALLWQPFWILCNQTLPSFQLLSHGPREGFTPLKKMLLSVATFKLPFSTAMYPHEYKKLHGNSRWANKINRKREKKYIQSDQPAWNPGGASATPQSRKTPVFDCAVALCTMQNTVLVTSNLTWLDLFSHTFSVDDSSKQAWGEVYMCVSVLAKHLSLVCPFGLR
jgi:hypothetical protein